ncbi:MAG: hypothetical protein IJ774_07140 [Selenomonadaceae bacterium]|nr:hypothetical protein [Selenomonadaceae bacterium]
MKVYDCFTFFNELELLELRLESLYDVVDRFVIVEADKTHANKPKPFNFRDNVERYRKFLPKIEYIMDTSTVPFKGVGDWSIENNQRNNIMQGLTDAEPDDLIMISDVDEFPDPATIKIIRDSFTDKGLHVDVIAFYDASPFTPNRLLPFHSGIRIPTLLDLSPVGCQQKFHTYYFDWVCPTLPWSGTVIGKFKHLSSPQDFRNRRESLPRVVDGGWHFSNMGGVDKLIAKMAAAVECVELSAVDKKYLDKTFVEAAMSRGEYFHTPAKFVPCDVSEIKLPTLPAFVKRYPQFVRQPLS